ncbi:MAG: hypothetical protein ACE15F_08915 [bacterium]
MSVPKVRFWYISNMLFPLLLIPAVFVSFAPEWAPDGAGSPAPTRSFAMGFTPFPWDFTEEAVSGSYRFIRENGDLIAHHIDDGVPWTEALAGRPFSAALENDWRQRRQQSEGRRVLVSVTPLNGARSGLALYRGEKENMPLPQEFENKKLNDPAVMQAYLQYCRRAVETLRPDYLAIGIEVNELIHNAPGEWPAYGELYTHVYTALKKEQPDLPIFSTFTLHNLQNPGWADLKRQQEQIRAFLPQNDIVGISYYPFMAGHPEKPVEMLDWLRAFTDKPLAVTETGYPAETIFLPSYNLTIPSDPQKQTAYWETLLERANQDHYRFVVAFLHRDYDALWEKIKASSPEAFAVWKDCGFLDEKGTARSAFEIWKKYFARKRAW